MLLVLGAINLASTYFNDLPEIGNNQFYKISRIKLFYSSNAIVGIQTTYYSYEKKKNVKCAKNKSIKIMGVLSTKFIFQLDEFVISFGGIYNENGIQKIFFKTSY